MFFPYSKTRTINFSLEYGSYRLRLYEFKTNLAGDRPTLFAKFVLIFVPFIKYAGAT